MCCEADWKREVVPDHKFDFINVREFHRSDFLARLKYIWKYILVLKNLAVYGLDIFTAVTMISSNHWTNSISRKCGNNCAVNVSFSIAKWIFVGCIIFSFLLLGYETYKARKVVQSRDISYAFTNLMANDYYSLRSYDHFCLFCHIDNSTKRSDDFAFFIFFTFKDWKRLLLADGPRQSINALILYSFVYANGFETSDIPAYWDNSIITAMLLFSMIATVLIFAGSLVLLVAAAVLYVPLLCYIQGNLKEYVCHKVDKRISELIKRKQRDRIRKNAALEKKLAQGGTKNAQGELIQGVVPQPTLPDVSLDEEDYRSSKRKMEASKYDDTGIYPSPSPSGSLDVYKAYGQHPPQLGYEQPYQSGGLQYSAEEYGSSMRLTAGAAPVGIAYPPASSYSSLNLPNPHQPAIPPSRSQYSLSRGHDTYDSGSYESHSSSPGYSQPPRRTSGLAYEPSSGLSYGEEESAALAYTQSQTGQHYGRDPWAGRGTYRTR